MSTDPADPEIADFAERVITRFAGPGLGGEFRGAGAVPASKPEP